MANIETGMAAWLTTNVSSWSFKPNFLPQKTVLPAATYFLVDSQPTHTLARAGVVLRARFQFTFFSHTYGDVVTGVSALRTALSGYRGLMGSSVVLGAFEDSATDSYEPAANDSDNGTHMRHVDFFLNYLP